MRLLDYFARAQIVSLPARTDRRAEMTRELSRMNLSLQKNKLEFFDAIKPTDPAGFPNIGARGCFLSHLQILKQAQSDNLPNVLVMEDDLKFSETFHEHEPLAIQQLQQKPWHLAYLGHVADSPPSSALTLIPWTQPLLTTHFYAVNSTAFDRLISFLELVLSRPAGHRDGGPMHLDGAYSTFRHQNPDIQTLIACPPLGHQRSSRSDITPGLIDRLPVLRQLRGLSRRIIKR